MRARARQRAKQGSIARHLIVLAVAALVGTAAILKAWQQPPAWLLPERRIDLQALHWLRIHLLNAAGITAIATVAAALVPLFIWLRDRRRTERPSSQQARERDVMLRRVRRKWIKGLLQPSLAGTPALALGLRTRPDVLRAPASPARGPATEPQAVREGKAILDVFDEASGSLLILGAPGAGKTTLLLQLASALLDRAETDPSRPIPVMLNLETWAGPNRELAPWLLGEVNSNYGVPYPTASDWIAAGELVLLLDGLDQVGQESQAACAAAINTYQAAHGLTSLVICSRTQQLQRISVKLQMEEAVELQPLTDGQISDFINCLDKAGTDLNAIWTAMGSDEDLKELARTPLMLNVISAACSGPEPTEPPSHGTAKEWEVTLWDAYVKRLLGQRSQPRRYRYESQQATRWLAWLANELRSRSKSEFHLDRLSPSWLGALPDSHPRRKLDLAVFLNRPRTIREQMGDPFIEDLHSPEALAFDDSIGWAFMLLDTAITAMAAGGLAGGLARALTSGPTSGALAGFLSALASGLGVLLLSYVLYSFIPPAIWALFLCDEPGRGIRLATILSSCTGCLAAAAFGIAAGFGFGSAFGTPTGIGTGIGFGLWFGVRWAMNNGGARLTRNYATRILLALNDLTPWPWWQKDFLDAMTDRQLLRRSGSSYIFVHQMLRDYFADHHHHLQLQSQS